MFLRFCSPNGKNTNKKLLLYVFKNASCYYSLILGCFIHFKPRGKCQPAFRHISSTAAPQLNVLGIGGHGYIFFFPLKRGEEKKMEMIKIKREKKKKTELHNLSLGKKRVKSIKHSNHYNLSVSFMLLFHIYF